MPSGPFAVKSLERLGKELVHTFEDFEAVKQLICACFSQVPAAVEERVGKLKKQRSPATKMGHSLSSQPQ